MRINLEVGSLVVVVLTLSVVVSDSELVVAWSVWSSVSRLGLSIVSSSSSTNWEWVSVELADVTSVVTTGTIDESLLTVVQWSWGSSSVSVSLSVTNVVGEEIELRVENLLVIDVLIENGSSSRHVDSLEPVESHGVENFINWLRVIDSSLKGSSNSVSFSVEGLKSVIQVVLDSLLEILPSISGISLSISLSLSNISLLLNEEINLEIEWGLNLEEVVVVDLFESVSSEVKDGLDVLSSLQLNSINLSLKLGEESVSWGSSSSGGESNPVSIIDLVRLHGVVSGEVIVSIWDSVLVADIGSTSEAHLGGSISELVLETLTVGVTVGVAVSDIVSITMAGTNTATVSLSDTSLVTSGCNSSSEKSSCESFHTRVVLCIV